MDLRQQVASGIFWSVAQTWGSRAASLATFLVLVRLLGPESFGLVALALVFTGFFQTFAEQGLSNALVQREVLEREHLDAAFWSNVVVSAILTLAGICFSGAVAAVFKQPQLSPIIAWLSLDFILTGLSSTQQAILLRNMEYKRLALRSLVAKLGGGLVGITMALLRFGVWSLVAQTLVESMMSGIILWNVSSWRPCLSFSYRHFKELFRFGSNTIGIRFMAFLELHLDDLLVGYFLGPVALGYYAVAYRVLLNMLILLSNLGSAVVFPAFCRLQDDLDRLRRVFYQATRLSCLVAFPAFVGVAVLAPEWMILFFGSQWSPSVPVVQLLALVGLLRSAIQFNGNVLQAVGKPRWLLLYRVLLTMACLVAFALAVRGGIVAVAAAYVVVNYAAAPVSVWLIHRCIRLEWKTYLGQLGAPLVGALALAAAVFSVRYFFEGGVALPWQLVILTTVSALTFISSIYLQKPELLREAFQFAQLAIPQWRE